MRNWIHTVHFNARARAIGYPDFEQAIVALYAQGWSVNHIADKLGMHPAGVSRHMSALQITSRPRGGWHKTRPQLIVTYQGREWTTSDLAREMGTYRERVLALLYAGRLPGASYRKDVVLAEVTEGACSG